ncbi:MAG: flagellar biosynthetic protein FliR, partial [Rhodospirillales bacterium]|nr:flagellar biosynthetic protein FliR [Rhodospirillales bacterium]
MLSDFLEINAFQFVLLFTRLGTALSLFPGFGGALTPVRTRLLLALGITVILLPILGPDLPAMPKGTGDLALLVIGEASVGVFLGMI